MKVLKIREIVPFFDKKEIEAIVEIHNRIVFVTIEVKDGYEIEYNDRFDQCYMYRVPVDAVDFNNRNDEVYFDTFTNDKVYKAVVNLWNEKPVWNPCIENLWYSVDMWRER